ncbi:hypothetical protein Q4I32_008257 [Leishmania shawi]|uniref:Uncharacterized protein n=1 Tax=Leishmania shawi TaxID=5680 RepID=A0AAW3B947_9TRYP
MCHRYQQYISVTAQAGGRREDASGAVHALWRAWQVDAQLVFTEAARKGILSVANNLLQGSHACQAQHLLPANLCHLEYRAFCAAADLLQLIAESQMSSPALVQLQPYTTRHLRVTLFGQVMMTVDVECATRLVQSNATPAISPAVFPHRGDLRRLARFIDVPTSRLLHAALKRASDDSAMAYRLGNSREQAGKFLHVLIESELFIRIPVIASKEENGGLRQRMLQRVQYLESSARKADAIAVMKM